MAGDDLPLNRTMDGSGPMSTQVSRLVRRLVANNAGPFTFTGTCTYIVGETEVLLIDPGPADPAHLDAILSALDGRVLKAILVTHTHRDHSPGAAALQVRTGAPVVGPPPVLPRDPAAGLAGTALDAVHDRSYGPDRILDEGEVVACAGVSLRAVATPGHTSNHLAYALPAEAALFSGDHVMAWSTTVVAPPDGSMQDYLASLTRLLGGSEQVYWPGHGGPVREPQRFVRALLHHRRQREQAILARLRAGDRTPEAIVRRVYDGLAPALRGAAALSVMAHLEHLVQRGLARSEPGGWAPVGDGSGSG